VLFLYIVFGVWLVASAINQFQWKFWTKVQAFDVFGLLPCWTFFAPNPGTSDLRIVYRDILDNGGRSSWAEMVTLPNDNSFYRAIWNPEKFDSKAAFDLAQLLGTDAMAAKEHPRAALISMSYIQLLDPIMKCPRGEEAVARQFALISTRGHVPPRETVVIMLSQAHRFDCP
jgi:hypothetical protein